MLYSQQKTILSNIKNGVEDQYHDVEGITQQRPHQLPGITSPWDVLLLVY